MNCKHHNSIILVSLLLLPLFAGAQSNVTLLGSVQSERIPNVPSFTLDFNNENLSCTPHKLILNKNHKNIIEYHCSKSHNSTLPSKKKTSKNIYNQGRDQTKEIRQELKDKVANSTVYTVEIPQNKTKYPWVASRIAKEQLRDNFSGKMARWLLPAKFYVSVRPQLANNGVEKALSFRDAGSRAGFFYYYTFDSGYDLALQYEATINWNNEKKFINLSEISDSSRRLSSISLQKEDITVLIGKYWSAYYDIAGFTNHFMAFGALGSSAFNNNSDGAASGTGRADKIVQLHVDKEKYSTTLQYQLPHSNDGKEYHYGLAGSFIYKGWGNSKVGTAIAFGKFQKITPDMHITGIDGDDLSWITGFTYQKEKFTLNAVLSYTQNHMNDDQGNYFDSIGTELYLDYDITDNIRLASGINTLIPKDDDYKGEFNMKNFILSIQYTFGEKTFDDLVYIELSVPTGNLANGDSPKTSVAIGLRYLFDL